MPLRIAVVKILLKTLMAMCMIDVVSVKFVFVKKSLKLALTALASVRAGCVELIAGQFRSPGQKIS